MTVALVVLAVSNTASVGVALWLFSRHLTVTNDRMWAEFRLMANRIQAPETAVAQTIALEEVELGPPDTEWREHERLMEEMTEEAPVG